jgi:SnoaL-like protein
MAAKPRSAPTRRTPAVQDDALTVARAYHDAWTTRNFETAAHCLAETLVVEVPINEYPTRADFLSAVQLTREMTSAIDVLAEFGNASEALLLYDMRLPMTELRVAEHFTVADGQITRIRQIHDTAALRAAGVGQPVVG